MNDQLQTLDWQAVLLVKVHQQVLPPHYIGLSVSRMHFAQHPDGIVACGWDIPVAERQYPRVQLVGWIPTRDVPFVLPVQFQHKGDPRIATLIPTGSWVLPYDNDLYTIYLHFQQHTQALMQRIEANPLEPDMHTLLRRIVALFDAD